MIVSWNWLKEYVRLDMPVAELERRLMMAGLNHESTEEVGGDLAIDLEVTSNRPDCLGHLGIARETAVLFGRELKRPAAAPREAGPPVADATRVAVECPDLCPRYTARVLSGVKIADSPWWLQARLRTVGVAPINNVVDITNYVLLECGQPLHAFDLAQLRERRIVVRAARAGEKFQAINHKEYELESGMCVIADAARAVALGGVMGGAETEIGPHTTELLIEAADFLPSSIRTTARRLGLHSDSSYRFERGVDPEGVDWASRRCCELILELAGGALCQGAIDVSAARPARAPILLRFAQLKRVLGIDVPAEEVRRILTALGGQERRADGAAVEILPPSWRRDLDREIDLVEEVARIHGYERIPEDARVPMAPSRRSDRDRSLAAARRALTACGYDEALTPSLVTEEASQAFSPWSNAPALRTEMPILRGADRLRRSLVPSLLAARSTNESLANPVIQLFEIAKTYLPQVGGLPREELVLALTTGGAYLEAKGAVETLAEELCPGRSLGVRDAEAPLWAAGECCELWLDDERLAVVGRLAPEALKSFGLRGPACVAEIRLEVLLAQARTVARYAPLPPYPPVSLDLNPVFAEAVRWSDVAATATASAGELLEQLDYRETYRDGALLAAGKKKLLFSFTLRAEDRTLTSDEANAVRDRIVVALRDQLGADLS